MSIISLRVHNCSKLVGYNLLCRLSGLKVGRFPLVKNSIPSKYTLTSDSQLNRVLLPVRHLHGSCCVARADQKDLPSVPDSDDHTKSLTSKPADIQPSHLEHAAVVAGDDSAIQSESSKSSVAAGSKYCIVYTCKVCQTRSAKTFSKLSYEKGIVIVRCPGCSSLHLIADNLGWFKHFEHRNVEEMLKARGDSVKKFVSNDDTLELTVEDVVGRDAIKNVTSDKN